MAEPTTVYRVAEVPGVGQLQLELSDIIRQLSRDEITPAQANLRTQAVNAGLKRVQAALRATGLARAVDR